MLLFQAIVMLSTFRYRAVPRHKRGSPPSVRLVLKVGQPADKHERIFFRYPERCVAYHRDSTVPSCHRHCGRAELELGRLSCEFLVPFKFQGCGTRNAQTHRPRVRAKFKSTTSKAPSPSPRAVGDAVVQLPSRRSAPAG